MSVDNFIGFGIRGFRSIGDESIQYIGPFGKVHLLVGKNNVGKSNILTFVTDVLPKVKSHSHDMDQLMGGGDNIPQGDSWSDQTSRVVSIGIKKSDEIINNFGLSDVLAPILNTPSMTKEQDGQFWFDFEYIQDSQSSRYRLRPDAEQVKSALAEANISEQVFSRAVLNMLGNSGSLESNCINLINRLAPWKYIPDIENIETKRSITNDSDSDPSRSTGRGLILDLAKLQSPAAGNNYRTDKKKFDDLNKFLKDVLEDDTAHIEIPDQKDTIIVHTKSGEVLPLDSLGTGIEAIVLIAAAVTYQENKLFCIEEPELYLHPALQRRLIEYLVSDTNNHYLISTHSAAILNANISSISHITKEQWTRVDSVVTPAQLSNTVMDLGNRASDILQSNFIVWVEGPSDRLYIADWLKRYDPELVEGAHFSIMFYGGGLLNQLTVDDESSDFINLLKLNRNLAIVIDSDKTSPQKRLNATKRRIIEEVEAINALSWVTEGYTVENYVPHSIIQQAVNDEYPSKTYPIEDNNYKSPLGEKFTGVTTKPNKVAVARKVIEKDIQLEEYSVNLRDNIKKLSIDIRKANGLAESE